MTRVAILAMAILSAALPMSGCARKTVPTGEAGICYHVAPQADGSLKYNKLVKADSLEKCAANLEAMRIKFLRMGGSAQTLVGAYQSNFIFLERAGVLTSTSYEGPRYVALVRTGDGRLAIPGAMPQQ